MISWANSNNNLYPVDFVYNDNGTILTEDNFNPVININNTLIQYPDIRRMVVNLDYQSMMGYKDFNKASFGVPSSRAFQLSKDGLSTTVNDLDGYITETGTTVNDTAFGVKPSNGNERGYTYFGSSTNRVGIRFHKSLSNQFSIGITFRLIGNRQAWRNIWCIQNADQLRLETTDRDNNIGLYAENSMLSGPIQYTAYEWNKPISINICVNGTNMKKYVNGTLVAETTLTREVQQFNSIGLNCYRLFRPSQYTNHLQVYSLRVSDYQWNDEENMNLAKIDGTYQQTIATTMELREPTLPQYDEE